MKLIKRYKFGSDYINDHYRRMNIKSYNTSINCDAIYNQVYGKLTQISPLEFGDSESLVALIADCNLWYSGTSAP